MIKYIVNNYKVTGSFMAENTFVQFKNEIFFIDIYLFIFKWEARVHKEYVFVLVLNTE